MKLYGELISTIGSILEIYERGCKSYKKSMKVGILRYVCQFVAMLLLGGINGAIVAIMAIIRSIFMYRKKFTTKVMILWIGASVVIHSYFATSLVDFVPLLATIQFSIMARGQTAKSLKTAQVVNTAIWIVYHASYHAYVYMANSIILLIVGVVRLVKGTKDD